MRDLAKIERGAKTHNITVQERGFRALGGLLASGTYSTKELMHLQNNSSGNGDPISAEFYDVLLGKRNTRAIETLTRERDAARQDAKNQQLQKEQAQSAWATEQHKVRDLQSAWATEQHKVRDLQSAWATEQHKVRDLEKQVAFLQGQVAKSQRTP